MGADSLGDVAEGVDLNEMHLGLRVYIYKGSGLGFKVEGFGLIRVQGLGFRVQGLGFRASGL